MRYLWLLFFSLSTVCAQDSYFASLQYKLVGHNNVIEKGAISKDTNTLASGDWDGVIQIWSLPFGIKKTTMARHQKKITGLAFIDKKHLISSSEDGTIRVWDFTKGQQLYHFKRNIAITHLAVYNKMVVVAERDGQILTVDLQNRKISPLVRLGQKIKHLQVVNAKVLVVTQRGNVALLQFDGQILYKFANKFNIVSADMYSDYIVTADVNRQVRLWRNKKLLTSFTTAKSILQVFFVDRNRLLIYSGGNVYLYSLRDKKMQKMLEDAFFYTTVHSENWKHLVGFGNKNVYVYRLLATKKNTRAFDGDLAAYVKSNLRTPSRELAPGVVILPFMSAKNKTTQLGSLLAIMSMFTATYTPQKIMNLPLREVEEFYYEHDWLLAEQKLQKRAIANARQQFATNNMLWGKLIKVNKGYELSIFFDGDFPQRREKKVFADVAQIPVWVAQKIHEYTKATTLPVRDEKIAAADIHKMADILPVYFASRFTAELYAWKKIAAQNTHSTFVATHYSYSYSPDHLAPIWHLLRVDKRHPRHTYVREMLAHFYLKEKQNIKALGMYLALLEKDAQNPTLYMQMITALIQEDEWELQRLILLYCRSTLRDIYWYDVIAADYYINYAWELLPQADGKAMFRKKMDKAQQFLQAAYKNNRERWQAPASMIKVVTALKEPQEVLNKWFQRAIQYSKPKEAYGQKFHYLTPRWYGSKEKMLQFARKILNESTAHSPLRFIVLNAHRELLPNDDYYEQQDVWRDISRVFVPYLQVYPRDRIRRIWYWEYAMLAKRYRVAAQQYIKLQNLGQLQSLQSSAPFKSMNKTPLYAALAQEYKQDGEQYFYWLQQALRHNPRDWKRQREYTELLLQNNRQAEAYDHLQALILNSSKWKSEAEEKIADITPGKIAITSKKSQVLHIMAANKLPRKLLEKLSRDLNAKYQIQVQILPEMYSFNKHHFIAERRKKLQESLQRLYRVVGKDKVEAYRAVYDLEKDAEGDFELLRNLLQKTTKGKKMIRDLEENYRDRWNAQAVLGEVKREYTQYINPRGNVGLLLITTEEIGTVEKRQKFADAVTGAGIVSLANLYKFIDTSNAVNGIGYERTFKSSLHAVAGILGVAESTVPQCPLSFADTLFALDTQTTEFCYESARDIVAKYKTLP
ncbi:WD40 repeat domain-containing protein [Candidatus Uabimicrobium amorphum]|uniref:Anaphase-promoting complex subunit 4 WD40 domain-containing protein n=1 Tax=Uabimicrobium amorphum TaxID=2596890 RepID=A0A5S9F1T3_UABAM|nr:hypothetical protein [Candidatus Uabimicrobium amorphum]BBM82531.1 hypothetical protein UABAM_00874 [Candidatus Uabimicrobium amorphum]